MRVIIAKRAAGVSTGAMFSRQFLLRCSHRDTIATSLWKGVHELSAGAGAGVDLAALPSSRASVKIEGSALRRRQPVREGMC